MPLFLCLFRYVFLNFFMYVCVCMCSFLYLFMYVGLPFFIYVCVSFFISLCIYVCVDFVISLFLYVCMCVVISLCIDVCLPSLLVSQFCMLLVCVYIFRCFFMYVFLY